MSRTKRTPLPHNPSAPVGAGKFPPEFVKRMERGLVDVPKLSLSGNGEVWDPEAKRFRKKILTRKTRRYVGWKKEE